MNPADQPILFLALRSATLPLSMVDKYAETVLAQRISTISGVAQVQVFGAQKYAVRVRLDPRALAARDDRHRRGDGGGAAGQREPAERRARRDAPLVDAARRPASS